MPSQPTDQARAGHPDVNAREASPPTARLGPCELADWLSARSPELEHEWAEEIRVRSHGQGTEVDAVVLKFVRQLTAFVPPLLGPHSAQLEPLWVRACELFGAMAAKRGLAAGEVIEEFQILREVIVRALYNDPPSLGRALTLREILRLNRIVDRGVTHASVGHTDAMFFEFFEAQGVPTARSRLELVREAETQLELIDREMDDVLGRTQPERAESIEH